MLASASAVALPQKITRSRRFIPSLSARAVDSLLRRNERRAARALRELLVLRAGDAEQHRFTDAWGRVL